MADTCQNIKGQYDRFQATQLEAVVMDIIKLQEDFSIWTAQSSTKSLRSLMDPDEEQGEVKLLDMY